MLLPPIRTKFLKIFFACIFNKMAQYVGALMRTNCE